MNLSDDLTPSPDPAPLLRALRLHRRVRLTTRASLAVVVVALATIGLWPRAALRHAEIATATPTVATPAPLVVVTPPDPAPSVTAAPPPVTMTRDELIDSLKDQTYALIRWPDGREQLLLRR